MWFTARPERIKIDRLLFEESRKGEDVSQFPDIAGPLIIL
jgi:hypothetical protein